jgi:hypothetical protein
MAQYKSAIFGMFQIKMGRLFLRQIERVVNKLPIYRKKSRKKLAQFGQGRPNARRAPKGEFYSKNWKSGKNFTMKHFVAMGIARKTVYNVTAKLKPA